MPLALWAVSAADRSAGAGDGGVDPRPTGWNAMAAVGQHAGVPQREDLWEPEDDDAYEVARSELKARFARWAGSDDGEAIESLIHFKGQYLDGHLTRWNRDHLSELYLELYPAKVMVEDGDLDSTLDEGRSFLTFLAETGLLAEGSDPLDALVDHIGTIDEQFRVNMADPSLYSFGKRFWVEAAAEGIGPDDREAVEGFMDRFNARPRAERDGMIRSGRSAPRIGGMPGKSRGGRATPPGTPPRRPAAKGRRRRR